MSGHGRRGAVASGRAAKQLASPVEEKLLYSFHFL
jgi:hypothetical protein